MDLGNFSVGLAVKAIAISRTFYEKLGFEVFLGEASQGWLRKLRANGIEFVSKADETTPGRARCMVIDPDGNPILIDRHV